LHPAVTVERYYENYTEPAYRPGALEETRAAVLAALNGGRNLVLGIGLTTATTEISLGQGAPLTSADALGLTNGPRLSVWFAPSLWNPFDTAPDPLGEALVRAPLGGAVATVSSSSYDFPTASRYYINEFLRVAYVDTVNAIGQTLSGARAPFVQFSAFDGVHRWTQMALQLLGDPELQLYTGPLRTLDVTFPFLVFIENGYIEVTVKTGGVPLAGAAVTACKVGDFCRCAKRPPMGPAASPSKTRPSSPGAATATASPIVTRGGEGWTATTWIQVSGRAAFALLGARPNPSRGMLSIAFSLPRASAARIENLDAAGRLLDEREVGSLGPGEHVVPFEGSRVWRPGVFLVRLIQGDRMQTQRVALMR
jgi:hypothetical protein